MPRRPIRVTGAADAPLRAALRALRTELGVPEAFPPEVLAEAERAAREPTLPAYDATDIPLFTIDPPTSTDLDQAMHLSRRRTATACGTPSPTSPLSSYPARPWTRRRTAG